MSAPAMRRSFSLHFNGGSTHVEADCTTSRTLAELLADTLFSAFPQFTSLRASSAGSKGRSRELERVMERWCVCKAPRYSLNASLLFLSAEGRSATGAASSLKGRTRRGHSGDEMVEIPLSTATPIAPCELFIVALADGSPSAFVTGGSGGGGGGVAAGEESLHRQRRKPLGGRPASATSRAGRRRTATTTAEAPRPKRKYSRRATVAVHVNTGEGEDESAEEEEAEEEEIDNDDDDDDSGSELESSGGESDTAKGSDTPSGRGNSGEEEEEGEEGASDGEEAHGSSAVSSTVDSGTSDNDDDDDGGGAESSSSGGVEAVDDSDGAASNGDDVANMGEAEGGGRRRGRGKTQKERRTPPPESQPRRGSRRPTTTTTAVAVAAGAVAAAAKTAVGADGTVRTKRRYTRRATKAEPEEGGEVKRAGKRSRTQTAPRRSRRTAKGQSAGDAERLATASRTPSVGTPALLTPDGQPIKRKRGRPPKNAPRYVEATAVTATATATATAVGGRGSASSASPPPSLLAATTAAGAPHTRANSAVSSDPIPLPPRRHRNRTRSPGPSVVGADGKAVGSPGSPPPSPMGSGPGHASATASSSSSPVAEEGARQRTTGGASDPLLSRADASLKSMEHQRLHTAAAAAAASSFSGPGGEATGALGGKAFRFAGTASTAEEEEEEQRVKRTQRKIVVHMNDYRLPSEEGRAPGGGEHATPAHPLLPLAEEGGGAHWMPSGQGRQPPCFHGAHCHPPERGESCFAVPQTFQLPFLLDRAARLASASAGAVAASTKAAEDGRTATFLLTHPQACQAIPAVSLYGGLATAYEMAAPTSCASLGDTGPAPLLSAAAGKCKREATEEEVEGDEETRRRWRRRRSGSAPRTRPANEGQPLKAETANDGAQTPRDGVHNGSGADVKPGVPALLDDEELSALAQQRFFSLSTLSNDGNAVGGDDGGRHRIAGGRGDEAMEEEETGAEAEAEEIFCEPSHVSLSLPLIVGGCVRLINPDSREKSHQWTVYVRGLFNGQPPTTATTTTTTDADADASSGKKDDYLSSFVDHVTFFLDKSFVPCVRTVYEAPFEVTEMGWGEFVVSIHVHLRFPKYNPLTRAMKRTLKDFLSGSGGRAALLASTGPGRGASGLDPVTSMNIASGGNRGVHVNTAASTDTNALVDSFLDMNHNSAARSLYYRGPFLPPHLHRGPAVPHRAEVKREGCDEEGEPSAEAEAALCELLQDYLRDHEEEEAEARRDALAAAAAAAGCLDGRAPHTRAADRTAEGEGQDAEEDSPLPSSLPQSPSSSVPDDSRSTAGGAIGTGEGGGACPSAVPLRKKRGPKPSRRGSATARSASLSQVPSSLFPAAAAAAAGAGGGAASVGRDGGPVTGGQGMKVLRAGHAGNVAVLSHLLRFSHRSRTAPLIPPHGDVRSPRKHEHLGYTLVPEPVVTEHYDELVVPLYSLGNAKKVAAQYKGVRARLRMEEAAHAQMMSTHEEGSLRGRTAVERQIKLEEEEGEEEGEEGRFLHRRRDSASPHATAIHQCEARIRALKALLTELTHVVRADRRLLRDAAVLESRLRDSLQVYYLSGRPPAVRSGLESTAALPFPAYHTQLAQQRGPGQEQERLSREPSEASHTGRGGGGGVSVWNHILSYGNALEKDILWTLSYLSSVAESAWSEGWLTFALLQSRCRTFPRQRAPIHPTDAVQRGGGVEGPLSGGRAVPSANAPKPRTTKKEEAESSPRPAGLSRLRSTFCSRLPSAVYPLTDLEFDLAAGTLLASLMPRHSQPPLVQGGGGGGGGGERGLADDTNEAMTTESAQLFADVLLPSTTKIDAARLSLIESAVVGGDADDDDDDEAASVHVATPTLPAKREDGNEEGEEGTATGPLAGLARERRLYYPLYKESIPGSAAAEGIHSSGGGGASSHSSPSSFPKLDALTGTMTVGPSSHGHGGHAAAGRAAAAAAVTALLSSRGLLPPSPALPSPPPSLTSPLGNPTMPLFASGEARLQLGEAADVAQLLAMKDALLEATWAMRAEAARRQAALTLRQV